jgi:hypothetical protein
VVGDGGVRQLRIWRKFRVVTAARLRAAWRGADQVRMLLVGTVAIVHGPCRELC